MSARRAGLRGVTAFGMDEKDGVVCRSVQPAKKGAPAARLAPFFAG
jgi:hypothetical protein